jgi:hypothetical protein
MVSKRMFIALAVLLATASAHADQIKLKKNFFTGYKYSVDGGDYRKVGFSGKELRAVMEGNEAAQARMDKYKSRKTASAVAGIPGGFMTGWVIGGSLAGDYKDAYTPMLIIGIPLCIVSGVLEGSANSHLKQAVEAYNRGPEEAPKGEGGVISDYNVGRSPRLGFTVGLRF